MYVLSSNKGEETIKEWVTQGALQSWMARRPSSDHVELKDQPGILLQYQIINCRSHFVALVENDRLVQVVGRRQWRQT
jgi:hypothetical protein